jgi:hypothetical protein
MAQTCLQELSYYPKIAIWPIVLAQQQESVKMAPTKGDSTGAKVCLRTLVLLWARAREGSRRHSGQGKGKPEQRPLSAARQAGEQCETASIGGAASKRAYRERR